MPALRVRYSKTYLEQFKHASPAVQRKVAEFIKEKSQGKKPSGKDKASGYDDQGNVQCQPFVDLNMRHFHLHPSSEPILAYQDLTEDLEMLWLVCITSHDEMFRGNSQQFLVTYDDDLVKP